MQFRVFVLVCLMSSGCLHRGADAVSTAMGALAAQAMESHDCVVPDPIQKSEPAAEVNAPKDGAAIKSAAPEASVEDELRALMAEDPRMSAIVDLVVCNEDDRAMFRQQIIRAEGACRDAWNLHDDLDGFGPEESMAMLDAKVAYEQFVDDCGATPGEIAYLTDFWAQVWKPGNGDGGVANYTDDWDGCFGAPPDRAAQDGAQLEYYLNEGWEGAAER